MHRITCIKKAKKTAFTRRCAVELDIYFQAVGLAGRDEAKPLEEVGRREQNLRTQ